MSKILFTLPYIQVIDDNGVPCPGALINTYESGTVDTPRPTWNNADGTTPHLNTNPVVCDAGGRVVMYGDGNYHLVITKADATTIEDIDPVALSSEGSGFLTNVNTIDDLRNLAAGVSDTVLVNGYFLAGDGGGGMFRWDATSTASDNNGTIFGSYTTGRWIRVIGADQLIDIRWFGAVGGSNSGTAIQAARTFAIAAGQYLVAYHASGGAYILESETYDNAYSLPIVLFPNAVLTWSGYNLLVSPVIQISDTTKHFIYTGGDSPVFPGQAEIKNVWLNGVSVVVITDNAGTWTAGSVVVTINGTAYTQAWSVDKNTSMTALAVQIATNTTVASATYSATTHKITITGNAGYSLAVSAVTTGVTGTMTLTISSSGWAQHSLALQSDMDTAQQDIINIKGAAGQPIVLTDFVVVSTVSGTWTAGTIYAAINGRQYSQAWGTSKDASMGLLATQLSADSEVSEAVYTGGVLTITPKARKYLNFTTNVLAVTTLPATDTLAFSTVVGGTYAAGTINFAINSVTNSNTYSFDKNTTLTNLATAMAANGDVSTAAWDSSNNILTITPKAGKALYLTMDVSAVTGSVVLNQISQEEYDIVAEKNNLKLLTQNEGTFEVVFSTSIFTAEQKMYITYKIIKPLAAGSPTTVILSWPALNGTTSGATFAATGTPVPVAIRTDAIIPCWVVNNGNALGCLELKSDGSFLYHVLTYAGSNIVFFAFDISSVSKGVPGSTVTYSIYPT